MAVQPLLAERLAERLTQREAEPSVERLMEQLRQPLAETPGKRSGPTQPKPLTEPSTEPSTEPLPRRFGERLLKPSLAAPQDRGSRSVHHSAHNSRAPRTPEHAELMIEQMPGPTVRSRTAQQPTTREAHVPPTTHTTEPTGSLGFDPVALRDVASGHLAVVAVLG